MIAANIAKPPKIMMLSGAVSFLALPLLLSGSVLAESAKIATGEYSPFVSRQLPDNGITAAIVTAAFKTQDVEVSYEFMPWKRGYFETGFGKFIGTFPYVRNAEREAEYLYSEPLYTDKVRFFVSRNDDQERNWSGKAICIPLGYDVTLAQDFIDKNSMVLERPAEMKHCFKMLDAKRVEAVWASKLVGLELASGISHIYPLEDKLVPGQDIKYYFIVSRKLPEGKKWLDRFNTGLKLIQKNGSYKNILSRFSKNQG